MPDPPSRRSTTASPPAPGVGEPAAIVGDVTKSVAAEHTESAWCGAVTELLVSVRDRQEIGDALSVGVDILDLKEPRDGALAPSDPQLWRFAADAVSASPAGDDRVLSGSVPYAPLPHAESTRPRAFGSARPFLSAALGESGQAPEIARLVPREFEFAKVGPSDCVAMGHLRHLWETVRGELPQPVELVAVAYADHRQATCPRPEEIFAEAAELGFRRCLIDTFVKDGRSTLDHLGLPRLAKLATLAQSLGLWWSLAGSICLEHLSLLNRHHVVPSCIGIRGDLCDIDRRGSLNVGRLGRWKRQLHRSAKGREQGPDASEEFPGEASTR